MLNKSIYYSRYILLTVIIVLVLIISVISSINIYLSTPNKLNHIKIIYIEPGFSLMKISDLLYRNNIITNQMMFVISAKIMGFSNKLKSGEYEFQNQVSPREIFRNLLEGKVIIHKITIPEGYTNYQIYKLIDDLKILTGNITKHYPEGLLFPDTYEYIYGERKQNILEKMYSKANNILHNLWNERPSDSILKNKEEALVLASIIEKETNINAEKPIISSVFHNRLKKNMPLQADPTIIYSLSNFIGNLGRSLTKKDLKIISPYNSYLLKGLPPTAICNPGRKSIEAAIFPNTTNYLYFVVNGLGGHNFSSNLKQHNNNVVKYRQNFVNIEKK